MKITCTNLGKTMKTALSLRDVISLIEAKYNIDFSKMSYTVIDHNPYFHNMDDKYHFSSKDGKVNILMPFISSESYAHEYACNFMWMNLPLKDSFIEVLDKDMKLIEKFFYINTERGEYKYRDYVIDCEWLYNKIHS